MRLTLEGFTDVARPAGNTAVESDTVPTKLFMLERLIAVVFCDPWRIIRLDGLLEMLKSPPTKTVWVALPVAPILSVTASLTV